MKKMIYILLLTSIGLQLNARCPFCRVQMDTGGQVRQAAGGAMGQTIPAYRGEGSQQAAVESEGDDMYSEEEGQDIE